MKNLRLIHSPLHYAKAVERPGFIGKSRPRSVPKKLGLAYEAKLAKVLGKSAAHGSWFEFLDGEGKAWCQTDFIIPYMGAACIIEVKYTLVPEAEQKLRHLYMPVVSAALQRVTCGLIICKNITQHVPGPLALSLDEALKLARGGDIPVLCWEPRMDLGFNGPARKSPGKISSHENRVQT